MNFDEEYPETFFPREDDMAICSECKGKKFNHGCMGYWRYLHTKKGCKHKWRNASGQSVEEFTEKIIRCE